MLTDSNPGTLSATARPMLIEDSWSRSREFGLRAKQPPDFGGVGKTDLHLLHEQNQTLMRHATPVMETLHAQIIDTESMIALTDASGMVLHSIGDDTFSLRAAHVGLRPGVNWSEQQKGTNAVGTAIFEELPTVVHGSQHFLEAHQFLTCSAAPIFAPGGDLVGVLDVSGDYRGYHRHTMGLVRMSAQMIENALFQRTYTGQLTVAFHSRPEFIGTLMEGLIAFAPDGRVLSANRSACLQFELSRSTLTTHTALSLLGRSASELTAATATAITTPLQCMVPSGVRVYVVPNAQLVRRFTGFSPEPVVDKTAETSSQRIESTSEYARVPAVVASDSHSREHDLERYPFATLDYLDSGDTRIASVVERLRRVADSPVSILIEAETGAGKEWFSRAIHRASRRSDAPFVAVNCAAIPDGLIESELFGYEDGAFTGARRKGHRGKIAQADGGTLFLDEIGDMPTAMQARLLRVLQDRVVTPLGGSKAIPVDIRLICATHHRLRDLITAKAFRDDLYYRLNGLTVRLPPLRERTDVRELVLRMHAALSGSKAGLSEDVLALMLNHRWPGNLRQLNNVLSTARAIAGPDADICREHLPDDFLDDVCEDAACEHLTVASTRAPASGARLVNATNAERSTHALSSLDSVALTAIRRALDRHRGNVSAAARELGVSRNTLYRRLSQNKLQP